MFNEADRKRLSELQAALAGETDVRERERRNTEYQLFKVDLAAKYRGHRDTSLGDDAEAGGP